MLGQDLYAHVSNFHIITFQGEFFQFTNWGPDKPEGDGDAINILWDYFKGCLWKWNDDHSSKTLPFICEYQAVDFPPTI